MFNNIRLQEALTAYKQDFVSTQWKNEKYKWEAVKNFQDNWDVNATDFAAMLTRSLSKTYNLLTSMNNFPAGMIEGFAKTAPEEVRAMFIALFDERNDVVSRISGFKAKAFALLEKYGNGAKNHYQNENPVSTYLWLRYPDKYYIYKYGEVKTVADKLESDLHFKKGDYADNLRNFYRLYDEICGALKQDAGLAELLKSQLTDSCYPDPELRTLTIDVGFYISRFFAQKGNEAEVAEESVPATEPTTEGEPLEISADELHSSANFQKWMNPVIVALRELGGSAPRQEAHDKIIELYEVSEAELDKQNKSGSSSLINQIDWARNYLAYEGFIDKSAGKGIWTLSALGEKIIISDELSGKIVAKWVKIKTAVRENKPLPEINLEKYYQYICRAAKEPDKYGKAAFLGEVYMSESRYDMLVRVLQNKKNIILQGAPGVGKTFAAKRLAYSIMGEVDENRIEFVQFHQNYSYEDFVMGYKPVNDGFELKSGIFYRFCQKAANQPDKHFFFIIDEINRGNMSKIFGELLMLIERDYRGTKATLAYNGLAFSVPEKLYIIGMMNTADRSLAMIDYALRRRFSFFEMEPGFDSEGFIKYQKSLNDETLNELIYKVMDLNREIAMDRSLGKGFCIGHSYFCGQTVCSEEWMRSIVDYDILPMLSEYWFDDNAKLQRWDNILHGVFQ